MRSVYENSRFHQDALLGGDMLCIREITVLNVINCISNPANMEEVEITLLSEQNNMVCNQWKVQVLTLTK